MLGVPPEDRDQFKKWTDDLALFLGDFRRAAERIEVAQQSALDMIDYLGGIIQECRKNPRNDLITALVSAEEEGDKFSEEELFSMFVLLQIGGHETTTNLIGNGLLALLQNPSEMRKLKDDPSLIGTAVEELLRYHSPIQSTSRFATEDMEFGGQRFAKGDVIRLYIGAANRDPDRFPEPNRLDITRQDNRHLSFALGPHFCLGAALARMEAQIAIGTVIKRMPGLQLEPPYSSEMRLEDFPWRQNPMFHGLESLPVVFNAVST
jgi:cytochrome P450